MKKIMLFKGLTKPTNVSTTGIENLQFEGCGLQDVIRGLFVEMSTREPSFSTLFKSLQKKKGKNKQCCRAGGYFSTSSNKALIKIPKIPEGKIKPNAVQLFQKMITFVQRLTYCLN